jgi:hypothetical protein
MLMTDPILFWNEVALEANRVSHTNDDKREQPGPVLSARALAIVHLAMHDAYRAADPAAGYAYYLPGLDDCPDDATVAGAVAGAAHATLSALFPSQRDYFAAKLGEVHGPLEPGFDYGVHIAGEMLRDRADDPGVEDTGYVPRRRRGHHRPDPDNPDQGFYGPFYGARSKGFAITDRHALDAPFVDEAEYLPAFRQVRRKGIAPDLMGTLPAGTERRTNDETVIGLFWAYDGADNIGTPPRLYNQIVRRVADHQGNSPARNARLFALVNVAMADAGILAWEEKYRWNLWRPVVGIREHDASMGAGTAAYNNLDNDTDIGWRPLGAPATNSLNRTFVVVTAPAFPSNQAVHGQVKNFTPNFPAYPSGHATFGAAALHITRLFYETPLGDRSADNLFAGLDFVSDELNGVNQDNRGAVRPRHVRSFPGGLWQMIVENGLSRVYLGVHWVFDSFAVREGVEPVDPDLDRNVGGVPLGLAIAEDIFHHDMVKSGCAPRAVSLFR